MTSRNENITFIEFFLFNCYCLYMNSNHRGTKMIKVLTAFTINVAFMRAPINFRKSQSAPTKKMHHDFLVMWIVSFLVSLSLSVYLVVFLQTHIVWGLYFLIFNIHVIPVFFCLIYRDKTLNYESYFRDDLYVIRPNFTTSIDSVQSWFLLGFTSTMFFQSIDLVNSLKFQGTPTEVVFEVLFILYFALTLLLSFLRWYINKKIQ